MATWTFTSKNTATWDLPYKSGSGVTWAQATDTWANTSETWAALAGVTWSFVSKS